MSKRRLLIIFALSAVFLTLIATLYYINATRATNINDESEQYVINYKIDDLVSVKVIPASGMQYEFTLSGSDSSENYRLVSEETVDNLSQLLIDVLFEKCSKLKADSLISRHIDSLEEYGFVEPKSAVTCTFKDDKQYTLLIGNKAPGGKQTYVLQEAAKDLYLISNAITDLFSLELFNYHRVYLTPVWANPKNQINYIHLNSQGVWPELIIQRELQSGSVSSSEFKMITPANAVINKDNLTTWLLSSLASLNNNALFLAENVYDLKPYGLDNPKLSIILSDDLGQYTILVGDYNEYAYITREGSNIVAKIPSSSLGFFAMDYFTLLSPQIITLNKDVQSSISYYDYTEGATYSLTFNDEEYQINDKPIDKDSLDSLIALTESIKTEGFAGAEAYEVTPDYSIKLLDGNNTEMLVNFHKINERKYLPVRNGENTGLFVSVREISELFNWLKEENQS